MALTYIDYLKIEDLLKLQNPRSTGPEHDEMLFIVIHQVYELWFKQILHEVDGLLPALENSDFPRVGNGLKRVLTILKTMVAQVDILETMTPIDFLSFRSFLDSASGFQSGQFRELEFVLGRKNEKVLAMHKEGTSARALLERRLKEKTLYDSFLVFLQKNGVSVPSQLLNRNLKESVVASEELQRELVKVYRNKPLLVPVCERLLDFDEGLQEWRYRHVKMVERTIGFKKGTGGSAGAEYLWTTISKPLFPDLWAIRSEL